MNRVLTRYWGSHFKSLRHVKKFEIAFGVLAERGWKCHLAVEREPDDCEWLRVLRGLGVGFHRVRRPRNSFDASHILAIRRLCRETGCTVFHCDNRHMTPLLGATLAGVPVKIWCKRAMNAHFEQGREPGWREKLAWTTRWSASLATQVVSVSGAVAGELLDLGIPRRKVRVLNNPRPEMRPAVVDREKVRASFGARADDVVFAAIGRMERVKGWDMLVQAFNRIAQSQPRARLLLVGAEDVVGQEAFRADVLKLAEACPAARRIHFAGHRTDVAPVLLAADAFVLPSRSEGCCNALLEALECGLPCVATKVGNAADVLVEGVNGLLVPRNDPAELAAAMERMCDDPARAAIAANARIPDSLTDRRGHAHQVADLYESLADEAGVLGPHDRFRPMIFPNPPLPWK